jgi:hypothetical protein
VPQKLYKGEEKFLLLTPPLKSQGNIKEKQQK